MPGLDLDQGRLGLGAIGRGAWAARMEAAARGRRDGRGQFALDDIGEGRPARMGGQGRRIERLRVGVPGVAERLRRKRVIAL